MEYFEIRFFVKCNKKKLYLINPYFVLETQ
jgi:hypothetical protein